MIKGRRREKRYRAVDDIFAVTKSNPGLLGNILDVSRQGLSFHCLINGEPNEEKFEIDLFFSKSGYLTKKIPCRKIFERTEHSQVPFSSMMIRRVGVIFIKLNPQQHRQIEHFINHLTDGQVQDRRCGLDRRSKRSSLLNDRQTGFGSRNFKNLKDRRHNVDRRLFYLKNGTTIDKT